MELYYFANPLHAWGKRTVFLDTFQPSRDPSTGWWRHSTGAGGASQLQDLCLAETCSGTQFTREHGISWDPVLCYHTVLRADLVSQAKDT